MNNFENRLIELGLILPPSPKPVAMYLPVTRTGNLIFTSGHLPLKDGVIEFGGLVGQDVEIEKAKQEARLCVLNCLASIKKIIGDLNKIVQIVKIVGYVASVPTFTRQPEVVNGASELLIEIFGEPGKHARSAIGVSSLPLNSCVEIEMIVEVEN